MGKPMETAANMARHGKALYDIIKAAMSGGWQKAAVVAAKHYWPYILIAAVLSIMLPFIILTSIPMLLFGFGSADPMTEEAANAEMCYAQYPLHISRLIEELLEPDNPDTTGTTATTGEPLPEDADLVVRTVVNGEAMSMNWFVALHSGYIGNDLTKVTQTGVEGFSRSTLSYTVQTIVHPPRETEPGTEGGGTGTGTGTTTAEPTNPTRPTEPETSSANQGGTDTTGTGQTGNGTGATGNNNQGAVTPSPSRPLIERIITITYLTPEELMDKMEFDDGQRNIAYNLYATMTDNDFYIEAAAPEPSATVSTETTATTEGAESHG